MKSDNCAGQREPWNKGKLAGQKPPPAAALFAQCRLGTSPVTRVLAHCDQ